MRKLWVLFAIISATPFSFAAQPVTVQQLEQILLQDHSKLDFERAKHILDLELTERVSAQKLQQLRSLVKGSKSEEALITLTDAASFLNLPPSELPDIPKPDLGTQKQIVARAVDYVGKTIHQLPNFFATRETTRYEDIPVGFPEGFGYTSVYQPLRVVSRSNSVVLVRDGKEVVEDAAGTERKPSTFAHVLSTQGEFGPILATVIVDASRGTMVWSNWEQGPSGTLAVFRISVPQPKSNYQVNWCCIAEVIGSTAKLHVFREFSGYHGEIAINPADGSIIRLLLIADLKPNDPISKAQIVVDYGPVEIGGHTYICPIKSVALSQEPAQIYVHWRTPESSKFDPQRLSLNDVAFVNYHLFRSESRILLGDNSAPGKGSASPEATASSNEAASEESFTSSSGAIAVPTPATTFAPPEPMSETAGVTLSPADNLPDSPPATASSDGEIDLGQTIPPSPVIVKVLALDKLGQPVTNLTRADFTVRDEGNDETLQSFTPPRASGADSQPASTIFLIDVAALSPTDLDLTRSSITNFVKDAPANSLFGLYALTGNRTQFLCEPTSDKAALLAATSQLQSQGSGAGSLSDDAAALNGLAHHLAVLPGEKRLVWITNATVASDERSNLIDRSSRIIDQAVLNSLASLEASHTLLTPLPAPSASQSAEAFAAQIARTALLELAFVPDVPPDGQFHRLSVQLAPPRDLALHYVPGYTSERTPATLKGQFESAVWALSDAAAIPVSASPIAGASVPTLTINIPAAAIALTQQDSEWVGKLNVYLALRDDATLRASVSGQAVNIHLDPAEYKKVQHDGISYTVPVTTDPQGDSLRVIVVDENARRIGSTTLLTSVFATK